jgi:hypothetical protein
MHLSVVCSIVATTAVGAQTTGASAAQTPRRGAWVSLGLGASNRALALAEAGAWYGFQNLALGLRFTDAETPFAAAGSAIGKRTDQALIIGWQNSARGDRFGFLISGGIARLREFETRGDNRTLVRSIDEVGPTLESQVGLRLSQHFGLAWTIFSVQSHSTSYIGSAVALRIGQVR